VCVCVCCVDTAARVTEGHRPPELVPDCCACGTAKYEMTFEGRWSAATHPKDYPTRLSNTIYTKAHTPLYFVRQQAVLDSNIF